MKRIIYITTLFLGLSLFLKAQNRPIEPIGVGETMAPFSLMSYQGETKSLAEYRGSKNVLLIFPRGKVLDSLWCPICFYQYAEMAMYEKLHHLKETFDLEIVYVLPYPKDSIKLWHEAAESGLNTVDSWKYPPNYETLTGPARNWADYVRKFFPHTFDLDGKYMDLSIPILMDEEKTISRGLFLFTKAWGGTYADQNIPTIFLIDKNGELRFKYHSQYTNDRPTADYIHEILKKVL